MKHRREAKWDTAGILLDAPAGGELDLAAFFGNSRLVEVEIGSGKGTFLLARAAARPDMNLLGVERARAYCLYAADRIRRAGLSNIRLIRADAAQLFETFLADESLWRVHIYFPDPWPKRRHHRRRLIQPPFIRHVRRTLQTGGQLVIVTDHLEYFGHIRTVLAGASGFAEVPFPRMADEGGELVGSNFERKYIAQGRPFYNIALLRHR